MYTRVTFVLITNLKVEIEFMNGTVGHARITQDSILLMSYFPVIYRT